jgi:lysine decarboxylase
MTQASLLLARQQVDLIRLKRVLNLLMTTSPSYILMASLDVARMQMATRGKELLDITIALAQKARKQINAIEGLRCFGRELLNQDGAYDLDPTKLVISLGALETTGYDVARALNQKHKIQVELADVDTILLIVSVGNRIKDISRLIKALEQVVSTIQKRHNGYKISSYPMELPELLMSPREAVFSRTKVVAIDSAIGMISAETFSPYPPGIPVLNPGERLSEGVIHYVKELYCQGSRIQGNSDVELKTIKVVDEN